MRRSVAGVRPVWNSTDRRPAHHARSPFRDEDPRKGHSQLIDQQASDLFAERFGVLASAGNQHHEVVGSPAHDNGLQ